MGFQIFQRSDMTFDQIDDMDEVPHAGSVHRLIVRAEHVQIGPLACGDLRHKRHQISGHAAGILTDNAALMGADGVEITQAGHAKLRIGAAQVLKHIFDDEFGLAIGVGGRAG